MNLRGIGEDAERIWERADADVHPYHSIQFARSCLEEGGEVKLRRQTGMSVFRMRRDVR